MLHPFFDFFNKNRPYIDTDPTKWPAEWKKISWKAYPRFPQIPLPKPELPNISLQDALSKRRSDRLYTKEAITLQEISTLVFYSCGLTQSARNVHSRRVQPSGGALYPIETYPLLFGCLEEIESGAYHYNVLRHCLEKLPAKHVEMLRQRAFHDPWVTQAPAVLLFSFVKDRTEPKYGNLSYKLGLLEAGHIGQNVYLACAALGLKCCALGGLDTELVHRSLDLDGINEVVFYSIAVGK